MVTFHPSVAVALSGFRPMVMIRKANGQMYGSRMSRTQTFQAADFARIYAKIVATDVARRMPHIARVAP